MCGNPQIRLEIGRMAVAILAGIAWGMGCPAIAHDSPEHVIEHLTERMRRSGETAALLYRRASEYRALRNWDRAAADLRQALTLQPDLTGARVELSRVHLAAGKLPAALVAINEALDQTGSKAERATLLMQRAEIYQAGGQWQQALADCELAFASGSNDIDWYLIRSAIQRRLDRWDACERDLNEGFDQTGSSVLMVEWIEALIDSEKYQEALTRIEPELRDSRWQSSWLIRRGRARLGLGQATAAREDLRRAIEEIERRLSPSRPDITLLADRGLAYALLGEQTKAQDDLLTARKAGAPSWSLDRLEFVLERKSRPGR